MADKNKALEAAVTQIERAFGKGSIMRMGARTASEQIEVIPSGSLGLDIALGVGGLPRGRIVEVYGPESSGKTTLACMPSPRRKNAAAPARSSTPSTRSTRPMPESSAWTWIIC